MAGGILAAILAPIGLLYAAASIYQPLDANFDPLIGELQGNRHQSSWAGVAEMKSCCFGSGDPQAFVLQKLGSLGWTPVEVGGFEEKFFGREYLDSGVQVFHRSAARLPCSDAFFVAVSFSDGSLSKAEGTWINAACV